MTRLLVADHEGLWLATTDGERRQLVDGATRWAIPDRADGVLFQRVETGAWRPVHDPAAPDTAHWRWVGSGTAQPIWRLQPGEAATILVEAPVDGRLELIDTANVDGDPTVAYLRTRYFTITTTEDRGPWWDSAVAELVVRNIDSGAERVLRTQYVGWEYSERAPTLGSRLALEVITDYSGQYQYIECWPLDATLEPGLELSACSEPSGWTNRDLVADLAPVGPTLAMARSGPGRSGELEVVSQDVDGGHEQQRVTITAGEGSWPLFVDTTGDHTMLLAATPATADDQPGLARGDEGPWVQLLQAKLSDHNMSHPDGLYLVPDGIFGPRTEAAVRALQSEGGLPATGIVDTATWEQLQPLTLYTEPTLIDPAGRTASITPIPPGTPVLPSPRHGPTITLWTGPDWPTTPTTPSQPEPLPILRPDGLGRYDFGAPANDLVEGLEPVLGAPTEDTSCTPPTAPGRINAVS